MGKLSTFFYVLTKTLTSPFYYTDIIKARFSFSLKFFYFFFFLYALISTVVIIPKLLPLKNLILIIPSKLVQIYPSSLQITINKGQASTNVPEPYYLPLKDVEKIFTNDKVLGTQTSKIVNLLVIDTKASVEDFPKYQTAALLTKNNLVVYDDDTGGYKVLLLKDFPDITINRQLVQNSLFKINPFINTVANFVIPVLTIIIFFSIFLFYPSVKLFYLLFFALIAFLISKILSIPTPYKKCYQISMHLIIIPTTIWGVLGLFGLNISFPFLQTIVMAILAIIVFLAIKNNQEATGIPQPVQPPIPPQSSNL
ncbi:MAG: DUF1189 family protein [Candidatus Gottesmanbacteria bacterium]